MDSKKTAVEESLFGDLFEEKSDEIILLKKLHESQFGQSDQERVLDDLKKYVLVRRNKEVFFEYNRRKYGIWKELHLLRKEYLGGGVSFGEEGKYYRGFSDYEGGLGGFDSFISWIIYYLFDGSRVAKISKESIQDVNTKLEKICEKFKSTPKEVFEIFQFGIIEKVCNSPPHFVRNGWYKILYPNGCEFLGQFKDNVKQGPCVEIYRKHEYEHHYIRKELEDMRVYRRQSRYLMEIPYYDDMKVFHTESIPHDELIPDFYGIYTGQYDNNNRSGDFVFHCLPFSIIGRIISTPGDEYYQYSTLNEHRYGNLKIIFPDGSFYEGKRSGEFIFSGSYHIPQYHNTQLTGKFITRVQEKSDDREQPPKFLYLPHDETESCRQIEILERESTKGRLKIKINNDQRHNIIIRRWFIRSRISLPVQTKEGTIGYDYDQPQARWFGEVCADLPVSCIKPSHTSFSRYMREKNYEVLEWMINSTDRLTTFYRPIDSQGAKPESPMLHVMYQGDVQMMRFLVGQGFDVNCRHGYGADVSILYDCLTNEEYEMVEVLLLESEDDVLDVHFGMTSCYSDQPRYPIQTAYKKMNYKVFMMLYEKGAYLGDVDTTYDFEITVKQNEVEKKEFEFESWKEEVYEPWMNNHRHRILEMKKAVCEEGWHPKNHMLFPKYFREKVWPLLHLDLPVEMLNYILSYLPVYKEVGSRFGVKKKEQERRSRRRRYNYHEDYFDREEIGELEVMGKD